MRQGFFSWYGKFGCRSECLCRRCIAARFLHHVACSISASDGRSVACGCWLAANSISLCKLTCST